MHLTRSLATAQHLLEREEYDAAIREMGTLFEEGLRKALGRLDKNITSRSEKEHFQNLEDQIGQGRTVTAFHLGQLSGFISDELIWNMLTRELDLNSSMARGIKWKMIAQWRNDAVHNGSKLDWEEMQATQMMVWAKVFLISFRLVDDETLIRPPQTEKPLQKDCPRCSKRMRSQWNFCPDCGSTLNVRCRNCGRPLKIDFKICPYCEMRTAGGGNDAHNEAEIEFAMLCRGAWMDGVLNARERSILNENRAKLGLDNVTAEKIIQQCAPPANLSYYSYVESAHLDGVITEEERLFLDQKARELGIDEWVKKEIEASFNDQLQELIRPAEHKNDG